MNTEKEISKVFNFIQSIAKDKKFNSQLVEKKFGEDRAWELMDELENRQLISFTEDIDIEFDGILIN